MQDALALDSLDSMKSHEMTKEIENFCKKRNKSNRKLARDVAEWVDMAVNSSQSTHRNETANSIESNSSSFAEFGDLEIENDE